MKYKELQRRLKQYQAAGLTVVRLNSSRSNLEEEYRRCLELNLSQNDLDRSICLINYNPIELISMWEIQATPRHFPIAIIKAKAYCLGRVKNLEQLKFAFPIFKDRKYDFRTKVSWLQCANAIDKLTKDSQDFAKFKQDLENFIKAIQEKKYYLLTGDNAVLEALEDLGNYISWWKGAQWEYNLATKASTLDLLKRAWLEQFLAQHNLGEMLEYSPSD